MKALITPFTRQVLTVLFLVLFFSLGVYFIFALRSLITVFLIACFAALLLSPFVSRLQKYKWPNILAILTTFLACLIIFGLFIASIVPVFVRVAEDSKQYVVRSIDALEVQAKTGFPALDSLPMNAGGFIRNRLPMQKIADLILDTNRVEVISSGLIGNIDNLQNFATNSLSQIGSIGILFASGITSFVTVFMLFLLLTFFILLERKELLRWFIHTLPSTLGHYFKHREHTIAKAIHSWLRGQLTLAVFMFAINFIGLSIAKFFGLPIHHVFGLSLIAGAMEFVPYIGPVIAFVPTFLMVLVSPDVGMWSILTVIGLYILFQQLEGNVMVPYIMSRTMQLSSLYILLATLAGAILGGPLGVLLAIPMASIIYIFYHDWMHYRATADQELTPIPLKQAKK